MPRRLIVRPEAEDDITDGATWYESQEPNLGLEFVSEIRAAIQRASSDPQAFFVFEKSPKFDVYLLSDCHIVFSILSGLTH